MIRVTDRRSDGVVRTRSTAAIDLSSNLQPLRRPANNTCVAIGASITQWGDVYHYPPTLSGMYLHQLSIESMQRIRDGGDYATGGYTFAQIQSTHLPQVLALNPAPGACIIGECTNDIAGAVPFATTVGILKAMVASFLGAGIVPILTTLAPDDAHATKAAVAKWNTWIRRYAALNGLPLLDSAIPLTGANGAYADASYTGDNLHPTDLGHRLIAQQGLGDGLADLFPPNSQFLTSRSTIDLTNLFGSGSLNWGLFTTNASGVGTGLTNVGSGGTASIVAPDPSDNLMGNWQRISTSSGQAGRALLTFLSGWSVGDRLALSARVRARGFNGANSYYDVQTQMARSSGTWSQGGSSVSTLVQGLNVGTADVDGLMYVEFDIYAATTSLRLQIDVGIVSGTGTPVLDVGELTVTNLTTGGLLV